MLKFEHVPDGTYDCTQDSTRYTIQGMISIIMIPKNEIDLTNTRTDIPDYLFKPWGTYPDVIPNL